MASVAMVVSNACSPDPRVLRSAKVLANAGHDVTVHAFDRNQSYPMSEARDGFRIMRYHLGSFSYGAKLATLRGLRRFVRTVTSSLLASPPDCVYCHDADTLAIGTKIAAKTSTKLIFDMHDLHHTWALMDKPNSWLRRFASRQLERKCLSRARLADLVITSSGKREGGTHGGFREYLEENNIDSIVVENRPYVQNEIVKTPRKGTWTIGYLGRVRGVETFQLLAQAIELMPLKERPHLKIAGDGTAVGEVHEFLLAEASRLGIHLSLNPAFETEALPELIQDVDVMFAMYPPHRGNIMQGALPVKMFDAASFGVPTLVNSGCLMGEVCELESLGAGAKWNDVASIAEALQSLKSVIVNLDDIGREQHDMLLEAVEAIL